MRVPLPIGAGVAWSSLVNERPVDAPSRLLALSAALCEALTPAEVAHAVLQHGLPALGARAGAVAMLGPDGAALSSLASFGEGALPFPGAPVSGVLGPQWVSSREELLQRFPLAELPESGRSFAVLPLVLKGRVTGGLTFSFDASGAPSERDRDLALAVGQQCAQALERARLYASEHQARLNAERAQERFALLASASEVFARALSTEGIYKALVAFILPRLADWLALDLREPDGSFRPVVLAHVNRSRETGLLALREHFLKATWPDEGPGRVMRTGEGVVYPKITREMVERAVGPELSRVFLEVGIVGAMSVPLFAQGQHVGVLTLGSAREDRKFGAEDLTLAQDLARRVALALDAAGTHAQAEVALEAARAAARRASFLADASEEFAQTLDPGGTLTRVAELAVPELADGCWVDLLHEGALERLAVVHRDPPRTNLAWELSRACPMSDRATIGPPNVLRTGTPELYRDFPEDLLSLSSADPLYLQTLSALGVRSTLIVPLRAHGETFGVVSLFNCESGRRFGADDLTFAQDLARRAALAVDNARLHAAEQLAREQAERAADHSARLQRVTAALSEAVTPIDVARAVVSEAVEGLGANDGAVWELRDEDNSFELVYSANYAPAMLAALRRLPLYAEAPVAVAAKTGAPVWLESREEYRQRFSLSEAVVTSPRDPYSAASLPLIAGGKIIGGLSMSFADARRFNPEERAFLIALSTQCAHALERSRLYRAAQEAVAARDEFLSIASHELKTPLTSLKLHIQTAASAHTAGVIDRSMEKLKRADRQLGRLTELIEKMLDLSRLRAGTLRLEPEPLDLAVVVREVVSELHEQHRDTPLTVACPDAVLGTWDRVRLGQVCTNLVGNAFKYGGNGPIEIAVEATATHVSLQVRDSGIGIAALDLDRLFQPFQRAQSVRHFGGLGLGLYISRRIVDAMGGSIQVESVEGKGSLFCVRLPRTPPLA